MGKIEIYDFLKNKNILHKITEHEAVYNMEQLEKVELPYPERDAKNLFVRDDKKKNYYLITVKGDKRVDLKEFKEKNGTRKLSFASSDDLMEIMELIPGAVTPLGLLNDKENRVEFFIDSDFLGGDGIIGIHPCDNTATVWIKAADLIDIIEEQGNKVNIIEL